MEEWPKDTLPSHVKYMETDAERRLDNIKDFYGEKFKSRCQSDDEEKINKGGDKRGRKSHYSKRIQTKDLRQEDVDP